jgi:hypothetical protein
MNIKQPRTGIPRARLSTILSLFAFLACAATTQSHAAGLLKVMRQGLGSGTVVGTAGTTINCGAVCDQLFFFGSPMVTLQATADAGSLFDKWSGDCAAFVGNSCTVTMSAARSVRAHFKRSVPVTPLAGAPTPGNIQTYLDANPDVNTAAEFLAALPEEYRKGWILMARSESLQTGTAKFPRVLLPSANSQYVFTLGLAQHASYPGSHPNAIEFMEYDATEKNFRFHEIVLDSIPAMGRVNQFPARTRGVSVDEQRCTRCHTTRNIRNPDPADAGTTGFPAGIVKWKNKPNWETYDSWGGMLPFNRDTIFPGSVEAAALRKLLNPWTWRNDTLSQQIMEQLALQSNGPGELPVYPAAHVFTRLNGGVNDGHIQFAFDPGVVTMEPAPVGGVTGPINYAFDGLPGAGVGTNINRDPTAPVILHAFATPTSGEGRGVQLFDQIAGLDGNFNQTRVGNELANHRFATGSVPLDTRPLALAINKGCIVTDSAGNISTTGGAPAFSGSLAFFTARHGGTNLAGIIADTSARSRDLTRRKADVQKFTLDRTGDDYLLDSDMTPDVDLIALYGPSTSFGTDTSLARLRQEIFRRPGGNDTSIMGGGFYVDREIYSFNTNRIALFRYLLEPLGVSVDKWSVNVRGRSRSYTFADVFGSYTGPITAELEASLNADPFPGLVAPYNCVNLVTAANASMAALPPASHIPTYTDVQRIFNKSCIECHGGLDYPPFAKFSTDPTIFDLSEREDPPSGDRLLGSYETLMNLGLIGADAASSYLYSRITASSEDCPFGVMPCGGPKLPQADIETIRRWIDGGSPLTWGDPHIVTVDGVEYDFQSAGEFTLLRGMGLEIQTRQTPVATDGPLPAHPHSGLATCASLNTAAAVQIGGHRVTYQPRVDSAQPNREGLVLRIDGKVYPYPGARGIVVDGVRIMATPTAGGLQIQGPGGTEVIVTPGFWEHYQVWYLNVDVRSARATYGIMGQIAPQNWVPALSDGSLLGPRPAPLADRYKQLYQKYADSWRVTATTSLFDYAPGTDTSTYTLRTWPGFQPTSCQVPKGWTWNPELPKKAPPDVAKRVCAAVKQPNMRANCEADVILTGDVTFANVYAGGEQIRLNARPKQVTLEKPAAFDDKVSRNVEFAWQPTTDKNQGKLVYMHCLWPQGEKFTRKHCQDVRDGATNTSVYDLTPGQFYYWKVIVDDGQGATVESETRRFQVEGKLEAKLAAK